MMRLGKLAVPSIAYDRCHLDVLRRQGFGGPSVTSVLLRRRMAVPFVAYDRYRLGVLRRQGAMEDHSSPPFHYGEEWSGRRDSNSRPLAPEASALPG